jgi:anti-sigma-K factor RskA
MNDQLVGYLIGALEIDDSRQVDQNLVECEETRRKLEIFRLALFPLEAIEHADPPAPSIGAKTSKQSLPACGIRVANYSRRDPLALRSLGFCV